MAHAPSKMSTKAAVESSNPAIRAAEERTKGYVPRILSVLERDGTFAATDLALKPASEGGKVEIYRGKVRDRYDTGSQVCLVTTDRLSGSIGSRRILFKGVVLNGVSRWWFKQTQHIVTNHVIENEVLQRKAPNVTMGRKCQTFPIEFVMRGYLTGSTGTSIAKNYFNGVRKYCGHDLPDGLRKNQKLPMGNLLTPTTKSDEHDELISAEDIVARGMMTQEDWDFCAAKATSCLPWAKDCSRARLHPVDTKYEFGRDVATGEILLIDEIHTPDSSRYWIADTYDAAMGEGGSGVPGNIDKEFVRLWFKERCDPYDDTAVLPTAPNDLLATIRRYLMLYELITGEQFTFPADEMVRTRRFKRLAECSLAWKAWCPKKFTHTIHEKLFKNPRSAFKHVLSGCKKKHSGGR